MLEDSTSDLDLTNASSDRVNALNEKIFTIYKPPGQDSYLTTEEIQDLMKHKKLTSRDSSSNLFKNIPSSPIGSVSNVDKDENPRPPEPETTQSYKILEEAGHVNTCFQTEGRDTAVTWTSLPVLTQPLSKTKDTNETNDTSLV